MTDSRPGSRRRIVVATDDTIAASMAGPGIRAWQFADALAAEHDVRLVSTASASLTSDRFDVSWVDDDGLRAAVEWCEVLIFQGWVMARRSFISQSDAIVVVDAYDPMHFEQLEQAKDVGPHGRRVAIAAVTTVLNEQLRRADFVLCASEKQRDLWLGHLSALGRVNASTYDADPSLRSLIDVVPFGVADTPPTRTGPGIRGVLPGVNEGDHVILWGGGIYNWFDPVTLLRAVDRLRHDVPDVRLVFMGGRHPNPAIPEMRVAVEARTVARELGLEGTHVFFNEGWVPYDERQNHLLDADVGVSTHRDEVEAAFSFRTRVLDYFWCRLPVVVTAGDWFGDLVAAREVGVAVEPGDVEGLADALKRVLTDDVFAEQCRRNIDQVVPELRWSSAVTPLLAFCRAPHRAVDLVDPYERRLLERPVAVALPPTTGLRGMWHNARALVDEGGARLLLRRLAGRLGRKAGLRRGA